MSATKLWKSDDELFALAQRELFTCVVGDVMDKLDLQHQFCLRRSGRFARIWS